MPAFFVDRMTLVMCCFIACLALNGCQKPVTQNAQTAEKWIAAWNSHNVESVIPLFTDDVLYEDVSFEAVNHGSTELRKFAAFFFDAVPDLKLELANSSINQGHGTIEWIFSGTDKGVYKTGKKFNVRGVTVIDVRDGKISRNLDYYDTAAIMRQVGVLPTQKADSAK